MTLRILSGGVFNTQPRWHRLSFSFWDAVAHDWRCWALPLSSGWARSCQSQSPEAARRVREHISSEGVGEQRDGNAAHIRHSNRSRATSALVAVGSRCYGPDPDDL